MIKSFTAELTGIQFRFNVVNALKLEVFQVYAMYNEKRTRFHMQIRDSGKFEITDKDRCPAEFKALESELSELILNSQIIIPKPEVV
jgi:hypothetical protein